MSSNIRINKVCEFCRESFVAQQYRTKFCSHKCNQKYYKQKVADGKKAFVREEYITEQRANIIGVPGVNKPTVEKLLLTMKELTAVSGISSRTLYRLIKEKAFPKLKIGRKLLFQKHQVLDYLNHKYGNICEENLEKENLRKVG